MAVRNLMVDEKEEDELHDTIKDDDDKKMTFLRKLRIIRLTK